MAGRYLLFSASHKRHAQESDGKSVSKVIDEKSLLGKDVHKTRPSD
jgi:hypothetical protein